MWTYRNCCVAHARRVDDDLSDDYYKKGTDLVIKHLKFVE